MEIHTKYVHFSVYVSYNKNISQKNTTFMLWLKVLLLLNLVKGWTYYRTIMTDSGSPLRLEWKGRGGQPEVDVGVHLTIPHPRDDWHRVPPSCSFTKHRQTESIREPPRLPRPKRQSGNLMGRRGPRLQDRNPQFLN